MLLPAAFRAAFLPAFLDRVRAAFLAPFLADHLAVIQSRPLIPALVTPRSLSHAPTVSAPVTGGPGLSLSDRITERERTLGAGRRWLRSGTGAGT
jgi:hypothetical protein